MLQRRRIARGRSILLVYAGLFLTAALFIVYFVPTFARDLRGLAGQIPRVIGMVQSYAASAREIVARYNLPPGLERGVVNSLLQVETVLSHLGDNLFSYFLSSATVLSYVVIAPVIAYHILRDINRWRQRALVAMARYPLPYVDLIRDIDHVLTGFVRGQSIVAAAVALMVWTTSAILGLKFGAALGLIAGLGEFVPFFGPIAAAIPVVVAGLMKSTATGLWTTGFVLVIQWVDANLIVPRVTGPRVGLHPLWIIFALLAGGKLLGFWGVLLAVPLAGVSGAILKFGKTMWMGQVGAAR
jgi:predicted PurR-regulated permease PerM